MTRKYKGTREDYERKLARVMERLGVGAESYDYDWNRRGCWVQMRYRGRAYLFENTVERSAETCGLKNATDMFAQIVLSLEGLARAVENGIFTLDMLMAGVPSLPPAAEAPACFRALGFERVPADPGEVKARYRELAKTAHPDAGGDAAAFLALQTNFGTCLEWLADHGGNGDA